MKRTLKKIANRFRDLHRDDTGATMVEYILLIAAIALPLLGLLYWFRDDLWEFFMGRWEDAKNE
jgi:Flp pilus assembly pilin Flp